MLYSPQQEEERKRKESVKSMVKLSDDSSFLKLHPEDKPAFFWLSP